MPKVFVTKLATLQWHVHVPCTIPIMPVSIMPVMRGPILSCITYTCGSLGLQPPCVLLVHRGDELPEVYHAQLLVVVPCSEHNGA